MTKRTFSPNESVLDNDYKLRWSLVVNTSLKPSQVFVDNSGAVKLPTSPLTNRMSVLIFNNGNGTLYLGDASVTTDNGMPVYPHSFLLINIEDSVDIYGIASASADIRTLS